MKVRQLLASKSQNGELRDVIVKSSGTGIALDQEKVSQYIKAISLTGSDKENTEKLAAMWMYTTHIGTLPPSSMRKSEPTSRPIMLIPASSGSTSLLATSPVAPPPLPMMTLPGMAYPGMSLPYLPPPPGSMLYAPPPPGSITSGTYRTHRSSKSCSGLHVDRQQHQQQRRRRAAQAVRSGKMEANRRQRRKSIGDVIDDQEAFQYTGLDRAIANSFLARQEQSHAVSHSHVDYSSSSSVGDTNGERAVVSRASSKTKIVCRDVVM